MFGRSNKPIVIDRYGSRRRRSVPRWVWQLGFGIALGVGGVLLAQEKLLPPRLSPAESGQLRASYTAADAERTRLAGELASTRTQLTAAQAAQQQASSELSALQRERDVLRGQIDALVEALPADPRDNPVQIRAARFRADGDKLQYDMVLTRTSSAAFSGVIEYVLIGRHARGVEATVTLDPIPVRVSGRYEVASGAAPVPAGYRPTQATIRILDRAGGRLMGTRTLQVP